MNNENKIGISYYNENTNNTLMKIRKKNILTRSTVSFFISSKLMLLSAIFLSYSNYFPRKNNNNKKEMLSLSLFLHANYAKVRN